MIYHTLAPLSELAFLSLHYPNLDNTAYTMTQEQIVYIPSGLTLDRARDGIDHAWRRS